MRGIARGPARLGTGGLYVKLLGSFLVVSLLPVGVMVALARRHLDRIQESSVRETQAALVSAEMGRLPERLLQEADRLASFFSRVQGETRTLRSFAQSVLATPAHFTYRNGSRYLPDSLEIGEAPEQRRRVNEQVAAEINRVTGWGLTDAF